MSSANCVVTKDGSEVGGKTGGFWQAPMLFTLLLWLCTTPFLLFLVPQFLGWQLTWYLAGAVLVAELVACWWLCTFDVFRQHPRGQGKGK